jgi:hypothetical protein
MPSLVDRYLDRTGSRSRIAQKTRRSSRDGPGKSRRELYGFSKEEALGRISNELFEIFSQSPSHWVSLLVLRGLARENRSHAAHQLRSQFSCDSTSFKNLAPSRQFGLGPLIDCLGQLHGNAPVKHAFFVGVRVSTRWTTAGLGANYRQRQPIGIQSNGTRKPMPALPPVTTATLFSSFLFINPFICDFQYDFSILRCPTENGH